MSESWDVVVVGAGPAGATTALLLARAGIKVLLVDRKSFPRDKSCGDGLTPYSVRLLHELGIGPALAGAHRIDGVTIAMRGGSSRDFAYGSLNGEYKHGLVVPRLTLDHALQRAAVAAGAQFVSGLDYRRLLWDGERVAGVEFATEAGAQHIAASMVVGANGAASTMRRDAKLKPQEALSPGFALRGYFKSPGADQKMVTIAMPLTDPTNSYVLPSYGWVFPVGNGMVNLGVGLFEDVPYENVSGLFRRFVADMTREDGLAPGGVATGKPLGAPLRFDFSPDASACPGMLLVGDAAGLVSPFTGEGISYALDSGRLAAEVIERYLRTSGSLDGADDEYRFLLGHKFAGYFEAGQKSARRYQLIWHVIESTFDSELPIYCTLRRLALVPEGAGNLVQQRVARDLTPLLPPGSMRLKSQLLKVGARLVASLRDDWPFLSRLELEGHSSGAVVFRPSVLFLAAATLGSADEEILVEAATALDLSYLAILAQSGIEEEKRLRAGVNWGNKFSVLLSDFLLAKAFELSSALGQEASAMILGSFEHSHAGLVDEQRLAWDPTIGAEEYLETMQRKLAPLFVLPCTLAALLVQGSQAAPALARYGSALSLAYALTEDVLLLSDPGRSTEMLLGTDYARGCLSLPVIEALQTDTSAATRIRNIYRSGTMKFEPLRRAILACGVMYQAEQTAQAFADEAESALKAVPDTPGTRLLKRLAVFSASAAPLQ